ncbi:MAG: hypothetical protein J0L76_07370 [Rhodobacterales bacterium]|nr:hypothetical protein [Rhodobacterales bacterium]
MVDGPGNLRHFTAMLVNAIITLHRAVLVAALTVALVATGFAHRLPGPQDEALAFALENGVSLEDICGDFGKAPHPGPECQACQIAGTADLPPLTGARIDLELAFQAAVIAPREVHARLRPDDPANRPQGPPVA